MAIEIVDLPMNSMVDLSIVFCKRLPEGRWNICGNYMETIWKNIWEHMGENIWKVYATYGTYVETI